MLYITIMYYNLCGPNFNFGTILFPDINTHQLSKNPATSSSAFTFGRNHSLFWIGCMESKGSKPSYTEFAALHSIGGSLFFEIFLKFRLRATSILASSGRLKKTRGNIFWKLVFIHWCREPGKGMVPMSFCIRGLILIIQSW